MQNNSVQRFLEEKVGYGAVEDLLKRKKLYTSLMRDALTGTLFGSWEERKNGNIDFPRIPRIKEYEGVLGYSSSLYLKRFLVGYTEEGIDGFFWMMKRNYLADGQIGGNKEKMIFHAPELRMKIEIEDPKLPKPCSIAFSINQNIREKYNESAQEFLKKVQKDSKPLDLKPLTSHLA